MRQSVFALYDDQTKYVSEKIASNMYVNGQIYSPHSELTLEILIAISKKCNSEYFYIIKSDIEIEFLNFDFSFKPPEWDNKYVHIWDNSTSVRLFHTASVAANPELYSDNNMLLGNVLLKVEPCSIFNPVVFDIIFLSYDEELADENFKKLKGRFPRAKRVAGVKGIYEAHKAAAKLVTTDMFYVVDADAEVLQSFDFSYSPHSLDREAVHVWHSVNPVNDLEYGYGGVKLFPTDILQNYTGSPIDLTTTVSSKFKVMSVVSNITKFNTDPFSAWRSAFRECAKLASKIIYNQENLESVKRLEVWCTTGADREFGDFTIMGANEGREFGELHKNQPDMIGLINDFKWLEKQFTA